MYRRTFSKLVYIIYILENISALNTGTQSNITNTIALTDKTKKFVGKFDLCVREVEGKDFYVFSSFKIVFKKTLWKQVTPELVIASQASRLICN
jgi:hypothetical protein